MAQQGWRLKSSWPFRIGCRVSGLELLRVETRQPKSEPDIWIDWWLGYIVDDGLHFYGALRRWTGAVFVDEPIKVYLDGSWKDKPLKRWSGTAWLTVDTTG
jgi:hypothetical protein